MNSADSGSVLEWHTIRLDESQVEKISTFSSLINRSNWDSQRSIQQAVTDCFLHYSLSSLPSIVALEFWCDDLSTLVFDLLDPALLHQSGLYYKLHNAHRPVNMKKPLIKRRKRVPAAPAAQVCLFFSTSFALDFRDRELIQLGMYLHRTVPPCSKLKLERKIPTPPDRTLLLPLLAQMPSLPSLPPLLLPPLHRNDARSIRRKPSLPLLLRRRRITNPFLKVTTTTTTSEEEVNLRITPLELPLSTIFTI